MRKPRMMLLAVAAAAVVLPSTASADVIHVVMPGETLSSIAAADGLSEPALAAANGLSAGAQLQAGAVIEIPPLAATGPVAATTTTATAGGASVTAGSSQSSGGYVVQPGDTLTGIAAADGTTVMALASYNGIDPNAILVSGTTLQVPGASGGASSTTASSSNAVKDSADQQVTGADSGPYPTDQFVDGPEVGSIAEEYGVDPGFAEAIGWQESGYNNDEVSPTGAVGVMQIEPDTWTWIQDHEAAGALQPDSATDNVRGGVLLLKDLIDQTGSDAEAAAAYYQGLGSVRSYGELAATRQYVADVMSLTAHFGG